MATTWHVLDNRLTHDDLPEPLTALMGEPYPPFWWYVSNGRLINDSLPSPVLVGAFRDCGQLKTAAIPERVKNIGSHAFAGTALKKVRVASDCNYSQTSFPADCVVERYQEVQNG
ncbi:MAG: leucine-rich repeat protein [Ruminococcus sp.]|nr:leucine-rich repeat protein [Ruminococcus sp.]